MKSIEYGIRGTSKKNIVQTHGSGSKTIKFGKQGSSKKSVEFGLRTPSSDFEKNGFIGNNPVNDNK